MLAISNPLCRTCPVNALNILGRKPSQYHVQKENGEYEYGYFTGNAAKYEIKTSDGITRGSYSYSDPNKVLRVTSYISDHLNGFRASNTEHGTKKDPLEKHDYQGTGGMILKININVASDCNELGLLISAY